MAVDKIHPDTAGGRRPGPDTNASSAAGAMAAGLSRRVGLKSLVALAVKLLSVVATFALTFALTRLLGDDGFGHYRVTFAWVTLLTLPVTGGAGQLMIRELSASAEAARWSRMRGIVRWAFRAVIRRGPLVMSASMAVFCASAYWRSGGVNSTDLTIFAIAMLSLPFMALTSLNGSALRGFHHGGWARVPEQLLHPLLILATVAVAAAVKWPVTPTFAAGGYMVAAVIVFAISNIARIKAAPAAMAIADPEMDCPLWRKEAWPMLLVGTMQLINIRADIVLLGMLDTKSAAGVYAASSSVATMISFVLLSINAPLASAISGLYQRREFARLQRVVRRFSWILLVSSGLCAAILFVLADWLMSVFGENFVAGSVSLRILCVGQFMVSAVGPVGILMTMTGRQRSAATLTISAAIANVLLNIALIPRWSIAGAAMATTISLSLMSVAMAVVIYRQTGVSALAVGPAYKDS